MGAIANIPGEEQDESEDLEESGDSQQDDDENLSIQFNPVFYYKLHYYRSCNSRLGS
jgi:hypothetical protein